MLSTCMQGQTGPYRDYAGFGDQGAALSGFFMLNGWPDRDPATPNGAYTDMATPHFGAAALMAALDYRARTGRGQHIDLSQIECGVHFLAPAGAGLHRPRPRPAAHGQPLAARCAARRVSSPG